MTHSARKNCLWVPLFAAAALSAHGQNIVINEIMYHPASQDVREEFVELFNAGPTNVNLSGWTLSGGIAFTFSNVTLNAGAYVAVAANLPQFNARYPGVANVAGGWLASTVTNVNGRLFTNFTPVLSNTRNSVNLNDAAGTRIDSVTYSDSGDWGVRRRGLVDGGARGWTWYAEHDGLGKTLELINVTLPNEHGQNWGSSTTAGGTPGAVNSIRSTNIAPLIVGAQHLPVIPRSTENISINARILNESATGLTVTLRWRVDGAASFSDTNMLDNGNSGDGVAGDGIYGALVGTQANNTIIEFYIEASDAQANTRTWPAPAMPAVDFGGTSGQIANALLQVDNSTQLTNSAPLYKLILTTFEQTELGYIFNSQNGRSANSDAEMNCTFLSLDATGIEYRYFCGTRNRGHGSRFASQHNYRINFPSDTPWKGITGFNMNASVVPAQVVGATVAQKAGAAGNNARFARLRVNNFTGPGGSPGDGLYACNEDIGSDWTDRQFPNNGGGNIYSVVRDIAPKEFNYRGENPVSYQNTYFKQSNASENDWRDLMGMLQVMGDNQTGSFTIGTAQQVANVEQWLFHLAAMNLMGNNESGINTGNNDDYYWYRGVNDPRFIMVYHDLDTVLGLGGSMGQTETNIFSATFCCASGDTVGIAAAMNFFMHHPQIEPLYYRTLQNLLDGPFSAAQFNSVVDQVLADFPHLAGTGSSMKSWMTTRRSTVQGVINGRVPPATNNPVATITGEPRSPTWRTAATLTVGGSTITHYQWRLNNGAWSAETPVATPVSLSSLANGSTNTVQVVGRNSGGIYQSTAAPSLSKTWVVNTALPTVRLNEVMARNDSAVAHFGTFPDMIELYNEGATTVTLTGMRLTDDPASPGKFTFPATTLAAGAYLILYADSAANPGLHTGFTLGANGDEVYLFNTVASGGARLDSVAFGPQLPNLSIGRFGVTGGWALAQPTFGVTNIAQSLGNARGLKLNEWLAASVPPSTEDFIEIYNPDPLPVAMGGMYLTDEPLGAPAMHRVADLSFVAGGGYLTFIADGSGGAGPDHLSFGLDSEQGQIGLFAADLSTVDCIVYGPQRTDISYGRCPNGSSGVSAQSFPTPGTPNSCPAPVAPAQTITLLPVNQIWTYNTNGVLPAVNWMMPGYDDSGWNGSGPAMLGRIANPPSEPVSTPLAQNTNAYTYYFRTHFNVPSNASFTSLVLSNLVDDGGVFYINGVEVGRIRMNPAPSPVDANTPAANSIGAASWSLPTSGFLSLTNIRPGDNVMAVEVHQTITTSADVVMAMRLNALIVTNSAAAAGVVISEVLANNATAYVVDGRTPDFIELYNPSTNAVDLAGLSLNDTANNTPPKWIFPPGSIIPARGYFLVHADADAPASAVNTGFGLGATGGGVYLFKKAPDTNEVFDRVIYGLQTADFSIGRIPVGGTNWALNYPTPGVTNVATTLGDPATLKVNEWMADPVSGDDWFEIYNPGSAPVLLSGLRLTDTFGAPDSFVIPGLSFIGLGSNAYQRFEADNPATPSGPEHVNFKLGKDGDSIFLLDPNNATVIDVISFGAQTTGVAQGRLPDGAGYAVSFPNSATPGDANYLPLTTVAVNEILTHTDPPLEDAIELINLTASPLNIGGWFLSDDKDSLRKFRIPNGTTLPANGFKVIHEIAFNNDTNGTPFALSSSEGDQVYLSEADEAGALTGNRTSAKVGPSANGVSFGRHVNSVGRVDYPAMSMRTFGQDSPASLPQFRSGTGLPNAYPKVGPVILSEIMYHPPDIIVPGVSTNDNLVEEFIELKNTSLSAVPLYDPAHATNGWRLRDAVDFTFTTAHTIPGNGHLLVVSFDPATNAAALGQFRSRYGSNYVLVGPYSGKLDNSTESVELERPDPPQPDGSVPYVLVEKVVYSDTTPWPPSADGFGMSLQRVSGSGYANDPTNWVAAVPAPGPFGQMDADGDGMPDDWEMANGLNKNFAGDAGLDPDMDGLTNLQEYLAGTDPQSAASVLRVAATLDAGSVNLSFTAVVGRTYSIVYGTSVVPGGAWSRLVDVTAQGVTGSYVHQDTTVVGGTQRFYRIVSPALP